MDNLIAAKRPVVVVAHPDDESLFGAGIILRYPNDWTVICCTIPFHDPIRAEKFHDACRVLGARGIVRQHPERVDHVPIPDLNEYDLIVTHNSVGEYGHKHHRELHDAIKPRWPDKTICFGYGVKPDLTIVLSGAEVAKKLEALKKYDHRSRTDKGKMKWEALLETFSKRFDLWSEPYTCGTDGRS